MSEGSEAEEIFPKQLTARKADFSNWYTQILFLADIVDRRYDVKGMFVWKAYGLSLMKSIKAIWDELFTESGIEEMYFPLIVPLKYASKNEEWFEGFRGSVFWTKGAEEEEATQILRPTGEPAIYPMFSLWIKSHADLPLRIYETVSSFRYETRHTRPLIRDREITLWYEIHTAHETKEEADAEIDEHVRINDEIWRRLAIPPIRVDKPRWEVFPGAVGAVEYYTIMPDGRLLENGSCNNLGQAYAKKYDIKFKDRSGDDGYAWQTCTGNGARYLAAVIGLHGDDRGLSLPPGIARTEVIVIPIVFRERKGEIIEASRQLVDALGKAGVRARLDDREDVTPGEKFFHWELRGIPVRIEVGPKELDRKTFLVFRRDTLTEEEVGAREVIEHVKELLGRIQETLRDHVERFYDEKIVTCSNLEDVGNVVSQGGVARVHWCEEKECWDKLKEVGEGVELIGSLLEESQGSCVVCGGHSSKEGLVGRTY